MTSSQADFRGLASELRHTAERDGYDTRRVLVGPLCLTLRMDPRCKDLGFEQSFTVSVDQRPQGVSDDVTIYIIESPENSLAGTLKAFVANAAKGLVDLSDPAHVDEFVLYDGPRRLVKIVDWHNRFGVLVFFERDLLPSWEIFSPVKEFIHLLALKRQCLLFHGATVVPDATVNQARLIVGPGGSGKSSLTAYALQQGMLTNGDDYVLVDLTAEQPVVWSVYRTFKLHPSSPAQAGVKHKPWRVDPITGKSVLLGQLKDKAGALLVKSHLTQICGLTLDDSQCSPNVSSPHRHPYLHSCMSTVQQMPYRIDATLKLSRVLHDRIPYRAHTMSRGIKGLQSALAFLGEDQP